MYLLMFFCFDGSDSKNSNLKKGKAQLNLFNQLNSRL